MPPYWPWVQAIRSYVREKDPDQLRSEMGAGAADIAEVVSDVKERLPDLKPPPALDSPEQARFRLFDSITAFLKSASLKQPLVLVLDDLHWADQPSLLLLQFVARELGNSRLLLIGTYRDVELNRQHPLAESLGELTRERLFQRVLLRGLSQQDVGRFIEVAAGVDPPAGLTEAVHTQTEGNPLFVTEVVRLLVQEGALSPDPSPSGRGETAGRGEGDSWTVRIPEGVREVIGRRLNRLSQRCNETLTIASVIGREFELRQLAPLVEDISEDRLLEEALSARVIEELPQAVGRYQFTHALIQETLSEELTLTRRVRLHARIAQVLEELYGDNADAHSAELAHHYVQAEAVLGSEKLVRYSLLAGERALATYAYEEALGHFHRGLKARGVPMTGSEPAKDSETAALLSGLGRAEVATVTRERIPGAVVSLSRAFDYYAEAGDVARAVGVIEYQVPAYPGHRTGMGQLIGRALDLVAPDSHQAGYLLSLYGRVLGWEEAEYLGAEEAFSKALAIARREGDEILEMRTLAAATVVNFMQIRWQEAVEKGLQAIELSRRVDDPSAESTARYWTSVTLATKGEVEGARLHSTANQTLAERLRDRVSVAHAFWPSEIVSYLEGDWRAAREFSDKGLAVLPMDPRLLMNRVPLEYQVGDFGQGEAHLERLLEAINLTPPGPTPAYSNPAMVIPLVARITGVADRFELAEEAAATVLSSPSVTPLLTMITRVGLAMMAVQRGEVAAAAEQYTALEPLRGTAMVSIMAADRLLGLLSHTMGNLDQGVGHFEEGLLFCRKAGYRPELAWTCCDYADILLQRNEPGDREKAMALLEESLAISSELGMRPLMERVLSRREILGA